MKPFVIVSLGLLMLAGCSTTNYGKPLNNGATVERNILDLFARNGCRMTLQAFKGQLDRDGYPVIAMRPDDFGNKAKMDAAKSRLLLESAPFIMQKKGLVVQDPKDKFTLISKGRGCQ